MKFFNFNKKNAETRSTSIDELYLGLFSLNNIKQSEINSLKIGAVYRAVNLISDSVAVMPVDFFKYKNNWKYKEYNDLYYLFNITPNGITSAYTMKKMMIQQILLNGNAYILITRDGTSIKRLDLLDSAKVEVMIDGKTSEPKYRYGDIIYDAADVIHIMNYTTNGYVGISTISYASLALGIAIKSEIHADTFFGGGGSMAGILRPVAGVNLTRDKAIAAKESLIKAMNDAGSNSIVVLDSGLEYQPISISPKDAQLLESRQFNIITIAQYFGVSPLLLFDLNKSNYNTIESQQIDFLNTTILPLIEKIENEIYRKIYNRVEFDIYEIKFDTSNLLRLDATTRATYYSQLYQMGAISTNEIRERENMNYPVSGGNEHFIQVNLKKINEI